MRTKQQKRERNKQEGKRIDECKKKREKKERKRPKQEKRYIDN